MADSPTRTRREHDSLGTVDVPADALYGAQTQRAVDNFPLGGQRAIGAYPTMMDALMLVKEAAARANRECGALDPAIADAIVAAAQRVREEKMHEQFPVHALHGGGGTSANMNANEVIANLANESLGGQRGEYQHVKPNDHVNLHQSTNDVYPTACHVAVLRDWPKAAAALGRLAEHLEQKADALREQKKLARTCLQDAVVITFGEYFGGCGATLRRGVQCAEWAVHQLHRVALGGSIVGRESDTPTLYRDAVIEALREVTGDAEYRAADNRFDAAQNIDELVRVSAQLDLIAGGIVKLAKDLRLMNSGPEGGLGEIELPAVQPGSSIMPGKVNPVMCEHAIQLCWRVQANASTCRRALEHGELDLNVWESPVVFALLESMELLSAAADTLGDKCIAGLRVREDRNAQHTEALIPMLTALAQQHGYARVSEICAQAGSDGATLRRLLREAFGV